LQGIAVPAYQRDAARDARPSLRAAPA
jgi:hypothetical protein